MLDLSRRAVEGLAAIERGGPHAWRIVAEFLRDAALADWSWREEAGRADRLTASKRADLDALGMHGGRGSSSWQARRNDGSALGATTRAP
jgi:hypothetical protein